MGSHRTSLVGLVSMLLDLREPEARRRVVALGRVLPEGDVQIGRPLVEPEPLVPDVRVPVAVHVADGGPHLGHEAADVGRGDGGAAQVPVGASLSRGLYGDAGGSLIA